MSCSAARSSRDEITTPRVCRYSHCVLHRPTQNTAEMLSRVTIVNFRGNTRDPMNHLTTWTLC